jgi:adenylate cyclase
MSQEDMTEETKVEAFWRQWALEGTSVEKRRLRHFYRILPSETRCRLCYAPFDKTAGSFVKTFFHVFPSRFNPHYCNFCDEFATQHQGGAKVPVTMLFADIRGSTTIAEKMGEKEFSNLINRFYVESTTTLCHADAIIEKLVGDEVTAIFTPGIAGEEYHRRAIESAKELLKVTGHGNGSEERIPIGIGIHSGETFVGSIGKPNGLMEVAALGDVPNTASRLTSLAGAGEILVSEDTMLAAKMDTQGLEKRNLQLKGRSKAIDAFVLHL